jgi:hypothetical protein
MAVPLPGSFPRRVKKFVCFKDRPLDAELHPTAPNLSMAG